FGSLYPFAPNDPSQPGEVRPAWSIGEQIDIELAWPACFALMEQQTGLVMRPEWLEVQRPTFAIPDPHSLFRSVANADSI
ncbi:MAG: hypothetical protein M3443_03845, partial [Actinomycetota bacterium]|nr:hypothetical protein [Actinomycetota bacterium]